VRQHDAFGSPWTRRCTAATRCRCPAHALPVSAKEAHPAMAGSFIRRSINSLRRNSGERTHARRNCDGFRAMKCQ